ncbi:hypothetical protein E8E11_007436 [Didymella keratinophila]|nr:hypothetical protein E8E11_007436 [Didymella keratinophila]
MQTGENAYLPAKQTPSPRVPTGSGNLNHDNQPTGYTEPHTHTPDPQLLGGKTAQSICASGSDIESGGMSALPAIPATGQESPPGDVCVKSNPPAATSPSKERSTPLEEKPSFSAPAAGAFESTLNQRRVTPVRISIWWWESICCAIAVMAFVSLIITLRMYDGHAVPDFPQGITFNTIISIFAVLIKTAAGLVAAEGLSHLKWAWYATCHPRNLYDIKAYDDASRGPWGAALLLGRLRWHNAVASAGAALTMMLLVLDPFTQQIVRQYSCTRPVDSLEASILRTQFIGHSSSYTHDSSIYKAILGGNVKEELFSCPTGYCSFEEYTTLAWTSTCIDETDQVFTADSYGNPTEMMTAENGTWRLPLCTWDVPTYRSLPPYMMTDLNRTDAETQVFSSGSCGFVLSWISYTDRLYGIKCAARPHIRTSTAEVVQGRLIETLVSTVEFTDLWETGWELKERPYYNDTGLVFSAVDMRSLDDPEHQKAGLRAMGYDFDNATRFLPYDFGNGEESRLSLRPLNGRPWTLCQQIQKASPLRRPADFDKLCEPDWEGNLGPTSEAVNLIPAKSLYQASSKSNWPLGIFDGIYRESKEDGATSYVTTTRGNEIPFTALREAATSISAAQAFMHNVTEAMSVHNRVHGTEGFSTPVKGVVLKQTTCVHIEWAWVTYATTVVILLLFFFIAMVWQGRSAQASLQRKWGAEQNCSFNFKSSALELLFHGLDRETLEQHTSSSAQNRAEALEKGARRATVKLVPTADGLRLASESD